MHIAYGVGLLSGPDVPESCFIMKHRVSVKDYTEFICKTSEHGSSLLSETQ